jgi:hypothetical protein
VEGEGVVDPEFLDSPGTIPGAVRLDDREQLVRDRIRESFSWWRPRALPCLSGPCINDLVAHRWYRPPLSPDQEIDAVRRIQSADICGPLRPSFRGFEDFAELLAGFHRQILKIADGHMPRYWRPRRSSLHDKHTNTLFYEDLVAAGVAAMWRAALRFDIEAGYRFWTGVRAAVLGAISDEARLWRRTGSGEGRIDRWLYTHPNATPEQVLQAQEQLYRRPVFHSLQEAAEGIKRFWAWGSVPEIDFDEDTEAAGSFAGMYSCFNRYTLSPQLEIHERLSLVVDRLSGGLDTGPDVGEVSRPKTPREPLDCTEMAVVRFKNGERQVTRQKARAGYRIPVTAELQAQALQDLEFVNQRLQRRMRRWPMPAKQYSRWSTIGEKGRAEHKNKQIIPAYVPITRFTWKVEYRCAEGDILSVLESPSWHCDNPKQPCEFCEEARSRSHSHNVAMAATPPRRALGRRRTTLEPRSKNPRTKPRTAETRLEQEKCQTQFAKQIATSRREKPYSPSPPGLPTRSLRTSRSG